MSKIELIKDTFGILVDSHGKQQKVKRFTWKNQNNIEAQVITYGARLVSLKLPDRKGARSDIVLGFDNMAGYLFYDDLYLGATIGRVTDKIENATFAIDGKQYWLTANSLLYHENGGCKGFDQVLWTPYVDQNKVMMHHVSLDGSEGYPGDLLVKVTFELLPKNEFRIDIEATCTKPTIVNISNLTYFNLAGHGSGPEELCRHVVSINSNCYTPTNENGLPTGEIMNVVYTNFDLQTPKAVNKIIGDGFDQVLCVNRGVDQGNCFVARAYHPPSGRILEVYSNQCGIHFCTANHFSYGLSDIPVTAILQQTESKNVFDLVDKMHGVVKMILRSNYSGYKDLREFLVKASEAKKRIRLEDEPPKQFSLDPLQADFLIKLRELARTTQTSKNPGCSELCSLLCDVLDDAVIKDPIDMESTPESRIRQTEIERWRRRQKKPGGVTRGNKIPAHYEMGKIYGKNQSVYRRHGAMCFQTQNYVNAVYHKNFPSPVLYPGKTYKHTVVYKFWIMSGTPKAITDK